MKIDWLKSTKEMRKILYRHLQPEMARKNLTLYKFLEKVTGRVPAGKGYDGNMRAGSYSRKSASLMFDWLQITNPASAKAVEQEIARIDEVIDDAWNLLLQLERKPLNIIPFNLDHAIGAASFPAVIPVHEISRGKPFYFRFENLNTGFAIGFQKQNHVWLPLPLDRLQNPVVVNEGRVELPRQPDGSTIDPIAEERARDLLEFLIVICSDESIAMPTNTTNLKEAAFQRDDLDEFANKALNASPNLYSTSLLVS